MTEEVHLRKGFQASIRQYQQQGHNWMSSMCKLGFGALLAEYMGLEKTVQVLALLESMRKPLNPSEQVEKLRMKKADIQPIVIQGKLA